MFAGSAMQCAENAERRTLWRTLWNDCPCMCVCVEKDERGDGGFKAEKEGGDD